MIITYPPQLWEDSVLGVKSCDMQFFFSFIFFGFFVLFCCLYFFCFAHHCYTADKRESLAADDALCFLSFMSIVSLAGFYFEDKPNVAFIFIFIVFIIKNTTSKVQIYSKTYSYQLLKYTIY